MGEPGGQFNFSFVIRLRGNLLGDGKIRFSESESVENGRGFAGGRHGSKCYD